LAERLFFHFAGVVFLWRVLIAIRETPTSMIPQVDPVKIVAKIILSAA
jgi:hypothetical protein